RGSRMGWRGRPAGSMRRLPSAVAILALVVAAAGAVTLSLLVGSEPLRSVSRSILLEYRLPRALLAFLAGASLAASGVCFQGLFRNGLADPFVVGVSGGAALGAVSSIVFGLV